VCADFTFTRSPISLQDEYDQKWQKRHRILNTLLITLFIFRLVFLKNKQGYGTTIAELWDYCKKMNIRLPQSKPVTAAAFGNARAKLDETIFKTLNTEVIRSYETDRNDFHWKNHRLFAVDGSKINLPKQLQNFSYKPPSNNAYYPQGLVSCLYQLKSKIPVDFDLTAHLDERQMAVNHLNVVNKNDVIVYDRGYFSYFMLYAHHKKGVHAIFRLATKSMTVIDEFAASQDIDRLVVIKPSKDRQREIRKKHPEVTFIPLSLRLIKYVVSDITYIIGTTLTDTQQYKTEEFSDVYHARWGIEELYKISKVLIDVEDFHGLTERGVKQELFAHFVLITFARIFANQTNDILMLNKTPKTLEKTKANLKNCLITVARNLEALFLEQVQRVKETISTIINLVATCRQKERANRSYVRRSHKPRKKWEKAKKKKNANLSETLA
jgi:Transposase DDE domain